MASPSHAMSYLAGVAALASVLLVGSDASATDGKSIAGAICHEVGRNQHNFEYTSQGALWNRSNGSRQIICPVVRDSLHERVNAVDVSVADINFHTDVSCSFYSRNRYGNGGWVSSASTRGANNVWQTLRLAEELRSYSEGLYYMTCSIPGVYEGLSSGIAGFLVDEHT